MSVRSRSQLLALLTEACELEHGLACCYLYAAFSLKQDLSEGGIDWRQLQRVRLWAAQIYMVAAEEMLHLAQAWNLLAAIGGVPYYLRPDFPQPSRYYPLNLPLLLQPFTLATIDRFIAFERPADTIPALAKHGDADVDADSPVFRTVGELYGLIADGFRAVPDVIIGFEGRQVGKETVDFPGLIKIASVDDALRAISMITEQGEGIDARHEDSHFAVFCEVRRQYLEELLESEQTGREFAPVREVIDNPVPFGIGDRASSGSTRITDATASEAADCFDSIYSHMLRLLQFVFDNATPCDALARVFGKTAIETMAVVVKPLGEALMLMPAGPGYENQCAGPGFRLARHVSLPTQSHAACVVATEKFVELAARLAALSVPFAPAQLRAAARNLDRIAVDFAEETRIALSGWIET